jgi:rod shape-determining protein MreC
VYTLLRLPLSAVESAVRVLLQLPRLPSLAHEHVALRNELVIARLELVRLREVIRNRTRASALTRSFASSADTVVTSIIGRAMIPTQHVVILDKGARDGLLADSVLVDLHGLVGRVLEVSSTTGSALLVTDPNSRIACLVERSRESGLLVGTGGTLCQLLYLDLEADVAEHDQVVTAGLEGPFPKGLLIGTVVKVVRDEQRSQAFAWVRPAVKLSQLEEVVCLLPSS